MIENPIQTTSAHLIWQSPLGQDVGSRHRKRVAILKRDGNDTTFQYLQNTPDFRDAVAEGFDGYTGIPLDRADTSDAINTLIRRLPNPSRGDYKKFLERHGLSPDNDLSDLSLLAYTGAKLTSDSFSISETFEGFDRPFRYIFDTAGRRHYQSTTPDTNNDDPVIFHHELDNSEDPNAIQLLDKNQEILGYIDASQAEIFGKWLNEGDIAGKVFRINGRVDYPRLFVICDINPIGALVDA